MSAEFSAIRLPVYLVGRTLPALGAILTPEKSFGVLGVRPGETGLTAERVGFTLGKTGLGFLVAIVILLGPAGPEVILFSGLSNLADLVLDRPHPTKRHRCGSGLTPEGATAN
jgi:hypothetical protein